MAGVFISYRRDDAAADAGRLFDDLARRCRRDHVFMDLEIPSGSRFPDVLSNKLEVCDVVLAIIGPHWLDATDPDSGARRLDDGNDFVRMEIAVALERKKTVIPVILPGARIPRPDELPEAIRELAWRNPFGLRRDRWAVDLNELVKELPSSLRCGQELAREQPGSVWASVLIDRPTNPLWVSLLTVFKLRYLPIMALALLVVLFLASLRPRTPLPELASIAARLNQSASNAELEQGFAELVKHGQVAVPTLLGFVRDPSPNVSKDIARSIVHDSLMSIGQGARPGVRRCLEDETVELVGSRATQAHADYLRFLMRTADDLGLWQPTWKERLLFRPSFKALLLSYLGAVSQLGEERKEEKRNLRDASGEALRILIRLQHPLSRVPLTRLDLTEQSLLDGNFRGADLSGTDLTSAFLTRVDLRGATLQGTKMHAAVLDHEWRTLSSDEKRVILQRRFGCLQGAAVDSEVGDLLSELGCSRP